MTTPVMTLGFFVWRCAIDDIIKPLVFGLIAGCWIFAITLCAALLFEAQDPLIISGLVASFVGASTWLFLARQEMEYDTWRRSVSNGKKHNGVTRVEYHNGSQLQRVQLPADMQRMQELGRGLMADVPFSEVEWCGAGRPFSKGQFKALRDEFLRRGWAEWRSDKSRAQGVVLSAPGRAVLAHFAQLPHPETGEVDL